LVFLGGWHAIVAHQLTGDLKDDPIDGEDPTGEIVGVDEAVEGPSLLVLSPFTAFVITCALA
jgi:hypothetical protein